MASPKIVQNNSALPSTPSPPIKKKRPRQSKELRRQLFAREYVRNGGNGTQAALSLPAPRGGKIKKGTAADLASRLLDEHETIALVHKWAVKARMEPEHALGAIGSGLEATSLIAGTDTEWPDWNARLKAADLATKLLRLQPRTGSRADAVAGRAIVHMHLGPEESAETVQGLADRQRIRHARRVNRPIDVQAIAVQEVDSPADLKTTENQDKPK